MSVERVVDEMELRRNDVEGVGEIRLASTTCPGGKLIADLVSMRPPSSGFSAAGSVALVVMVDDVNDRFTRLRVLRTLGIGCEDD